MARPDYGRARWYGAHSNGYSRANRPGANDINKIIVHITQGSWSSAINWFNDSRAGVSAHYVVRSNDGFIGQCVEEKDIAYHAGDWPVNKTSIGIEHEGYGNDPGWLTTDLYNSSARLSAYLSDKYNIPINRDHFLAHRQVSSTQCPGNYWDWERYLRLVRKYVRYHKIVDNASPRFSAPSSWKRSTWSSQKYGQDYHYVTPRAVAEPASFRFNIPKTANYRIYARWPASSGYNGSVPIGIRTTSGLKWVRRDQRKYGDRWVSLGTFNLAAGDAEKVRISRWTSSKGYVIADAVRIISA